MDYEMELNRLNDKADKIRWTQHMYHEEQLRLERIVNDLNATDDEKHSAVEKIGKLDKKIDKLDIKLCRVLQKIQIHNQKNEEEFNAFMARYDDEGYDHRYEVGDNW
jgi:chromosome segregation ATPase